MVNVGLLILYATTVLIYIIFLAFDAFGRDEPYGNLAYVVAVIPTNFLWVIVTDTVSIDEYLELGVDVTMVWTILILMWLIPMIRDMYFVKKKKKDFDDV
ncbi:MAG: hypothetical protein GY870_14180, partial [archaeon]|nr:hypothetical protein [archaeon]